MPSPTDPIASRQHPLCKLVRGLHDAARRKREKLFLAEGGNAVSAAIAARWPLHLLLATPQDLAAGWQDVATRAGIEARAVTAEILEYMGQAQTAPDVIALAKLPGLAPGNIEPTGLVVVLDGIADPGNLGTLLRSADAAGAGLVLTTLTSADAYGPKAVRASAGSLFHLPPATLSDHSAASIAAELARRQIPIVVSVARDGIDCFEYRWPAQCALVLGHETRGVSTPFEAVATARVTIPMHGRAESLNVAAAGAVLCYAWNRSARMA